MKHLEKLTRKHLGEILVDEGLISKSQLVDAEQERQRSGDPLGSILVEANYLSDWDLAKTVATQYQLPFVELKSVGITSDVEDMFHLEEQQKYRFVPIDRMASVLTMAVADMPDIEFLRGVRERTGLTPFLFVVLLSDITTHLLEQAGTPEEPAPEAVPETPEPVETVLDEAAIREAADWQKGLEVFDDADPEPEQVPAVAAAEDETPFGGGGDNEGWENIFDTGNDSVLKEMDRE